LAARTQGIYERQAARFDAERPKGLHERAWLDRFLSLVVPGGRVLDLGCGAGDPIAGYMRSRGFGVVGFDASHAMLAIARARDPSGDWRHGDMRTLDLGERFDGVIAWNSFFHLMPDEQREVLVRIARHLKPGAALMVTVGPEAGEVTGHVGGEAVYHSSLAPEEYRSLLASQAIEVVDFVMEDATCAEQTVLLARMSGELGDTVG
jgi:trans-aconitate methyltransferase